MYSWGEKLKSGRSADTPDSFQVFAARTAWKCVETGEKMTSTAVLWASEQRFVPFLNDGSRSGSPMY